MIKDIVLNLIIGLITGAILEFAYRSIKNNKLTKPFLVNAQMYGLTAVFLYFLYILDISIIYKIILILLFTTTIEYITGSLYLHFKKVHLWDYSTEFMNYKGIICPLFSFYWLVVALVFYCLFLPFLV